MEKPGTTLYTGYAIGLLTVIHLLSTLDRQILNILAEPIKGEFNLSDGQMGALIGLAFTASYVGLSVPIARLADRYNRIWVLSLCLAVWSGCTALGGIASSYLHLFLARIGVGAGESGVNPTSHSLIADLVPRAVRARALSVFNLSTPIGTFLGLAVGGVVADSFGWRAALLVVGVPGIAVALLALATLRDPRYTNGASLPKPNSFLSDLRELLGKPSYVFLVLGAACVVLVNYGKVAFYGSFFLRNHTEGLERLARQLEDLTGWSLGPVAIVGVLTGVGTLVFGMIGTVLGGWLGDRLGKSDPRGYMTVPVYGSLLQFPFLVVALWTPNVVLAFVFFAVPAVLTATYLSPLVAAMLGVVRPEVRSTASAILSTVGVGLGLGLGPFLIGSASDTYSWLLGDSALGLKWAMITAASSTVVAAVLFFFAQKSIAEDFVG